MTPHELAERQKRLGATDVAAILGVNPYKTAWEVAMEKRGLLEPQPDNAKMRAGRRFEPVILDVAEDELGPLERNVVAWADDAGFPLASTLDARLASSGVPVEAKTSGIEGPVWGRWGDVDTDEVPDVYLVQLSVQMLCTRAEAAYLYALLGGRGIVRYQAAAVRDIQQQIIDVCGPWWERHIVQGIEPERTTPVPLDVVKRLRRTANKVTAFDEKTTNLVEVWESAKRQKREAEKQVDELQSEILACLGDAEAAVLVDGRRFEYLEQLRKGYTVADGTMRVARLKKG